MPTQLEIAKHLDFVDDRSVREVLPKVARQIGIDHEADEKWFQTASMDQIRVGYVRHMREVASGRGDQYELTRERTRLVKEQADAEERKNLEADLVVRHIDVLTAVLSQTSVKIAAKLEAILVRIKREVGDLPPKALEIIETTIIDARNQAEAMELDWEYFDEMEEAARGGEEGSSSPESTGALEGVAVDGKALLPGS